MQGSSLQREGDVDNDSSTTSSLSKSDHIEKQRAKCFKYKDLVAKDVQTCLRGSNDILQETSDILAYKNENAQESTLQKQMNEQNEHEIQSEIDSWENGSMDLNSTQETQAILTHASLYLSQYLKEEWGNVHEIAQHMAQSLNIKIVWNESMSRVEMNCDNIFVAYLYVSDRRKLPLVTSLPDQLRQREDAVIMNKLMEKSRRKTPNDSDAMDVDEDQEEENTERAGSQHMMLHTKTAATMDVNELTVAFISKEELSEFYIDHIAVLATHEPSHLFPVSKYGVFRNIQKQLMKAVDYYSGCKGHKTFLLQSVVRYVHSYHRLYEKKARYSGNLLNSKLIPPHRTFHTYTPVESEKISI